MFFKKWKLDIETLCKDMKPVIMEKYEFDERFVIKFNFVAFSDYQGFDARKKTIDIKFEKSTKVMNF